MTRYFDASALVKLGIAEAESLALNAFLGQRPDPGITSVVAMAEVRIALARSGNAVAERALAARGWITLPSAAVLTMPLTMELSRHAAELGVRLGLRALDAIHVATAHAAREALSDVVTYDKAMIAACQALGLPVVSPGA